MMRTLRFTLRSLLMAGLAVSTANAADVNDFVDFSIADLPGRLFVPPEAQDSPRPVIVFLHGAGETGTNNLSQIGGNIDNLLAEAKRRGAFLYAPQATTVVGSIFNWGNIARTEAVVDQLDEILATQNAESSRVYLTGLSMGGGGTWNVTSRNPERFAAALPIAGVTVANDYVAANQLGTPTWAFHARDDSVVSNQNSRDVVGDIVLAAGEPAVSFPRRETGNNFEYVNDDIGLRYTEFPTGGHQIWPQVYNTPEVYDWMFSFTTIPEPSAACLALLTLAAGPLSARRRRS